MISNRDLVLEHQEREYEDNGREEYEHHQKYTAQLHSLMPPIDMASLTPSLAKSEEIAAGIIEAIRDGRISPLEFAVKKKCIEQALELAFKDVEIRAMTVNEVEKYGKEGATCLGAKVTVTSKRMYQYESDPTWKDLNESIKDTKDAMKEQEKKIQIACKNNVSLVGEGGELIASIVPAPETVSIAVSFAKKK